LILETASDPINSSILGYTDIRCFLDSIPHETGCKSKNQNDGEYTPYNPTLNKREKNVPCGIYRECGQEKDGGNDDEWDRVEWAMKLEWFGGQVGDESVEWFGT